MGNKAKGKKNQSIEDKYLAPLTITLFGRLNNGVIYEYAIRLIFIQERGLEWQDRERSKNQLSTKGNSP